VRTGFRAGWILIGGTAGSFGFVGSGLLLRGGCNNGWSPVWFFDVGLGLCAIHVQLIMSIYISLDFLE